MENKHQVWDSCHCPSPSICRACPALRSRFWNVPTLLQMLSQHMHCRFQNKESQPLQRRASKSFHILTGKLKCPIACESAGCWSAPGAPALAPSDVKLCTRKGSLDTLISALSVRGSASWWGGGLKRETAESASAMCWILWENVSHAETMCLNTEGIIYMQHTLSQN